MTTVILNLAAAVGLSIAALFGTNARVIGENSYFAVKNNTLHARIVEEKSQQQNETHDSIQFLNALSFRYDPKSIKETSRFIDQILNDAARVQIDADHSISNHTGVEISAR